jgi:aminoglycoside 2''-phosphotransferase
MSSGPPPAADLAPLLERIRAEFPNLDFQAASLIDDGADHRVVVLDDAWAFRFPRSPERIGFLQAELTVLALIAPVSPIPVPAYRFISRAKDFGGYRMIPGAPMRPTLFKSLGHGVQSSILDGIADFLRLIHALPPATIAREGGQIAHEWSGADWRRRWIAERREVVATVAAPALLRRMDRFYEVFAAAPPSPREVVTHGDLTDDHMLLAPDGSGLAGIIDFGDVCLADPAFDFAFLFAYGEAAARQVARRYDPGRADSSLLDRARSQFARYRIEQVWWGTKGSVPDDSAAIMAGLPTLFDRLEI